MVKYPPLPHSRSKNGVASLAYGERKHTGFVKFQMQLRPLLRGEVGAALQ